jgi:hypothetical protein
MMLSSGTTLAFQPFGLDVGHLIVGHSDEGFCFGIKDGIKGAGWNGKILVWQRIIAGFDPSRPSQPLLRKLEFSASRHVTTGMRIFKRSPPGKFVPLHDNNTNGR